jgi:glyoxylase-like metal-dependent hydrolase (beta-lactamase superfamily II)
MLGATQQSEPSPSVSMAEFCKKLPRADYTGIEQIESQDDWFELYQVAEGVTAIYEPHQWQEVISYLIEGTQSALLFDTGNGIGNIAKVVRSLTDKPIRVLNSHSHYDHVGGNHSFENIIGMQTPFTIARQQGHENKDIAIEVSEQALCRPLPLGVSQANHRGRPYKIKTFVEDGHSIDLGERSVEVMHLPGHTPDAIALIDREAGLMWTGDSYYSGPIWLFAPETDLAAYRDSLVKMIAESNKMQQLLPAHNVPLVAPSILPSVLLVFDAMIEGKLEKSHLGDGMVEYASKENPSFSFLMRDEPLPYR